MNAIGGSAGAVVDVGALAVTVTIPIVGDFGLMAEAMRGAAQKLWDMAATMDMARAEVERLRDELQQAAQSRAMLDATAQELRRENGALREALQHVIDRVVAAEGNLIGAVVAWDCEAIARAALDAGEGNHANG